MISTTTAVRRYQDFREQAKYQYWFTCEFTLCNHSGWLLGGVDEFTKVPFTGKFDPELDAMTDMVEYEFVNEMKLAFLQIASNDLEKKIEKKLEDKTLVWVFK